MNTEPRIRLTAELYMPFTRLPPGDKDTQLMLDWTFDRHTVEELYVGPPPVDPGRLTLASGSWEAAQATALTRWSRLSPRTLRMSSFGRSRSWSAGVNLHARMCHSTC